MALGPLGTETLTLNPAGGTRQDQKMNSGLANWGHKIQAVYKHGEDVKQANDADGDNSTVHMPMVVLMTSLMIKMTPALAPAT
jgi:hypothetical protein